MKSGQLPADLKSLVENARADVVNDKDGKMVSSNSNTTQVESKTTEAVKNDDLAPMEQVLYCILGGFLAVYFNFFFYCYLDNNDMTFSFLASVCAFLQFHVYSALPVKRFWFLKKPFADFSVL